jgi:hypothetical protein
MKALSLWQPWASLVIMGAKAWETRSWTTTYRGTLLIHASAKKGSKREKALFETDPYFGKYIKYIDLLPYGCLVGTVVLKNIYTTGWLLQHLEDDTTTNWKEEFVFDDFTPNRYAWQLENPIPFTHCLPMKGMLGLWDYNGIV